MSDLAEGQLVTPSVRLVRPLGEGGMGKVWLADHLALKTPVVVKFMSEELAARADSTERFSLEATAASQVRSPHVVQVLDHGFTETRVPYIVMEALEGRDLRHFLDERGHMTPEEAGVVVAHVCKALSRAYKRGIIHRDIKPENIFLCDHGAGEFFVKLLDFGIAKTAAPLANATASGTVMGTVPYMSPEQLLGDKAIDHRTDLWSLGVVVFEALTGTLPFPGDTVGAVTLAIHQPRTPLPSERRPELGTTFDAWFERACARAPAERFANAAEMGEAFRDALGLPQVDVPSGSLPADADASGPLPVVTAPMSHTVGELSGATIVDPPRFAGPARSRTRLAILVGGGVALTLGVVLWLVLRNPAATEPVGPNVPAASAPIGPQPTTSTATSTAASTTMMATASPAAPPSATMSVKATKPATPTPATASPTKSSKTPRNDAGIF